MVAWLFIVPFNSICWHVHQGTSHPLVDQFFIPTLQRYDSINVIQSMYLEMVLEFNLDLDFRRGYSSLLRVPIELILGLAAVIRDGNEVFVSKNIYQALGGLNTLRQFIETWLAHKVLTFLKT